MLTTAAAAPLPLSRARSILREMLSRQGPNWLPRYRAVWRAWRACDLPPWDRVPADRLVSSFAVLVAALATAGAHVTGEKRTPLAVLAALGMVPKEALQ